MDQKIAIRSENDADVSAITDVVSFNIRITTENSD
jgi:hypothetical protein